MMQETSRNLSKITHTLVNQIPEELEDGVLYVSMQFGTVVHKCACGCGEEVVTPLGPAEWQLTYDGKTISLAPSIGNWGFPCRSHYWIERNNVRWARGFTSIEVSEVRHRAKTRRENYYTDEIVEPVERESTTNSNDAVTDERKTNRWWRFFSKITSQIWK